MKTISFSEKEILHAMLEKRKDQTTRPAWNKKGPTKARFKVGDRAKFYWKQRLKATEFCRRCGDGVEKFHHGINFPCGHQTPRFEKLLGHGTIIEVFKIEMWVGNDAPLITGYDLKTTHAFAKRDGFKPGPRKKYMGFYNFFHKNYDLYEKKEFWVYRWRWHKTKTERLEAKMKNESDLEHEKRVRRIL